LGTEPTSVKELGIRTHHCLKRLGSEPTTVCYCLHFESASTSLWRTPATRSRSFLIAAKLYITTLLCFLFVRAYPCSIRSSQNTCTARVPFTSTLSLCSTSFPVCSGYIPVHSVQGSSIILGLHSKDFYKRLNTLFSFSRSIPFPATFYKALYQGLILVCALLKHFRSVPTHFCV
jgi:hypothetical protein